MLDWLPWEIPYCIQSVAQHGPFDSRRDLLMVDGLQELGWARRRAGLDDGYISLVVGGVDSMATAVMPNVVAVTRPGVVV